MHATPQSTTEPSSKASTEALGIDIGGTRVKFAWFAARAGTLLGTRVFPTADCLDKNGAPRFAAEIAAHVSEIERELGAPFAAIGLAAPGLVATDRRSIASMPGRLAGLVGLDWTTLLGRTDLVPVLNDGHAALLGEVWQGAAQGRRDVVMLTLGTGVGGAILAGGTLLQGVSGRAGHLGHVSLNPRGAADIVGTPGSLEDAIGECSLAQRTGGRFHCTKDLLAALHSGDAAAQRHWDDSIRALAAAIVSFVNTLDPELIVIGGGVAQAGDALFVPLRAQVAALEWKLFGRSVPILPAQLGDRGGTVGAAYSALSLHSGAPSSPDSESAPSAPTCAVAKLARASTVRSRTKASAAFATSQQADQVDPARLKIMKPAQEYIDKARLLTDAVEKQLPAIDRAADWFAATIVAGRMVHVFGSGHSRMMVEEMWPRYGSFPGFNPIVELSLSFHNLVVGANGQRQAMFLENVSGLARRILRNFSLSPKDTALIVSSSGCNVVPIEMAEAFREAGIRVVAIISQAHSDASTSRDARGRKLQDFADLVLDTGAPVGDAMVRLPGLDTPVAPGSTLGGCLLINTLKAEIAARLIALNQPPKVLTAGAIIGQKRATELFEAAYDEHAHRLAKLYATEPAKP